MADKRLALLDAVPLLELSTGILTIAQARVDCGIIPERAADDAVHIAVASAHEVDYFLT
jgi:hypothetical protein